MWTPACQARKGDALKLFKCTSCGTTLSAEDSHAGMLVRCPSCMATMRVPGEPPSLAGDGIGALQSTASASGAGVATAPPPMRQTVASPRVGGYAGRRFGFNCGYCSSRLEANEAVAAQEGVCPTCGNTITIPILDRYGRLIDPKTRQIIKQDPHPVHAYAAAGDRAPRITRLSDGAQVIVCPKCSVRSPITSNNCRSCGNPFTMEGTTLEAAGANNGYAVASLVLGIIGIPASCTLIVPLLAIIFGAIGYMQTTREGAAGSGRGMAIAGGICGVIGCGISVLMWLG